MSGPVTVVIPARNEAATIEACLRSVLAQDLSGGFEVLVLDDGSTDGTATVARQLGVEVLTNPRRGISAALNTGLTRARGQVLVRFDAHAEMPAGYLRACLGTLTEEAAAANVGGWRRVVPAGAWGRAVGAALASPFGVGNARIWRSPGETLRRFDIDSVPLGCFRAVAVEAVGGWDERLRANEDFELNRRLRQAGWRVVYDPSIWSIYRPREHLTDVIRQYLRYGWSKGRMLRADPGPPRPRQLAPVALMAVCCLACVPGRLGRSARAVLASYALALAAHGMSSGTGWRGPVVLASMHLPWGAAFIAGLAAPMER